MKKIVGAALAAVIIAVPAVASGGPPAPIPIQAGGGSAVVELPDFTYPADNGCYQVLGSLSLPGNNPASWDWLTADLTVTDSIGRITDSFFEFEDSYAGPIPLKQQLCELFDAPGNYTLTGTVEFNGFSGGEYSVPVSDTFTIFPYVAPTPPQTGPSAKCLKAKAALKKAKKQDKPPAVIKRLKKKVKRFC